MKRIQLAALAALAPLGLGAAPAAAAERSPSASWRHEAAGPSRVINGWSHRRPGIRIWTSSGEVYRRGERIRVFYRTERDAYVTIFRVDTDGRVRVLFPAHPSDDNFVAGARTYSVYNYGNDAFVVDDYPGVGYVFGVASDAPFLYDPVTNGGRWDHGLIADGRIHGDPYQSLEEVATQLLPPDYDEFDTHLLPYYVERRYDYPRFVCYDCHSYTPYYAWDPYSVFCSRFSLVIWRDPYYYYPSYWYPGRYYGGTRVVYVRPGVVVRDSRYVFKSRDGSDPGVVYRDRRLDQPAGRRPPERFVRGADIGGTGTVPVPGTERRVAPMGRDGVTPEPREPQQRDPVVVRGRRTPATEPRQPQRPGAGAPEERRAVEPRPGAVIPDQRPERRDAPQRPGAEQPERRRAEERPAGAGQVERPERREAQRPDARSEPAERRPSGAGAALPRERPAEARPQRPPENRPAPRAEPRQSRPEPRSQPQARPSSPSRPSSPPSNPGLVRRRPD